MLWNGSAMFSGKSEEHTYLYLDLKCLGEHLKAISERTNDLKDHLVSDLSKIFELRTSKTAEVGYLDPQHDKVLQNFAKAFVPQSSSQICSQKFVIWYSLVPWRSSRNRRTNDLWDRLILAIIIICFNVGVRASGMLSDSMEGPRPAQDCIWSSYWPIWIKTLAGNVFVAGPKNKRCSLALKTLLIFGFGWYRAVFYKKTPKSADSRWII